MFGGLVLFILFLLPAAVSLWQRRKGLIAITLGTPFEFGKLVGLFLNIEDPQIHVP